MTDLNATLAERGSRYGDFMNHAEITQDLKEIIFNHSRLCAAGGQ